MANDPQPKTRVGQIISDIRANRAENLKAKSEKLKAKAEVVKARAEGKATKIAARAEAKKMNRDYPLSTTPEPKSYGPVSDYSRSEKELDKKQVKTRINPINGKVDFLTTGK